MAKYRRNGEIRSIDDLIGAKVMFKNVPIELLHVIKNHYKDMFTINKVHIKASRVGTTIPLIELNELPNVLISTDMLEVLEYTSKDPSLTALCGTFLSGQVLVGKGVQAYPDSATDPEGYGIVEKDPTPEYLVSDYKSLSSVFNKLLGDTNDNRVEHIIM